MAWCGLGIHISPPFPLGEEEGDPPECPHCADTKPWAATFLAVYWSTGTVSMERAILMALFLSGGQKTRGIWVPEVSFSSGLDRGGGSCSIYGVFDRLCPASRISPD